MKKQASPIFETQDEIFSRAIERLDGSTDEPSP
jgi:hypothetical protein